ncbi:hypothetical protein FRY74_01305 [Vicingus serpentipes]|uniref:Outer membrane protein beta-barrel domain-containing protein n=1 Tax=Vicingus serpentipes TaxID=1926625 RepID=A0A5C6RYX3_9FLAO|nr:hypothetical protein [Vicingus serpentipes]TXB66850.1 hypothetical protein FRY74_01305 [Vicingus serpentipes]
MKHYFLILGLLFSIVAFGQVNTFSTPKDSAFTIPMITASYAHQWSAGDLSNRFGHNNNVGGSFAIKNKNHWYYGIKGNFIWGNKVNENTILSDLLTEDSYIIDNEGRLTSVFLEERGSSFFLVGGKLFNVLTKNNNSGILVYGGFGTLHHKIRIAFKDEVNTLSEENKKGYDRLSFGYAINGFIGYMHLSKNRFLNFFGGFDYTQGWTKSLRKYNYDTQQADTKVSNDILYGIRLGWIIRLNKRTQQEYYYD